MLLKYNGVMFCFQTGQFRQFIYFHVGVVVWIIIWDEC